MDGVCLSVYPSVAFLDLTRERKGLRSSKLAGWKPITRVTRNIYFEVEKSKVKVTGSQSVKALLLLLAVRAYMRKEDIGTATLFQNSHAVPV